MSLTKENGKVTDHFALQSMLMNNDLNYYGMSSFAYLRDTNSGKEDLPLEDEDNVPKSIN